MDERFDVYCGLDVGRSDHHATALNSAGERLFDKPLPQNEARLRELFMTLQQHGNVLMIVDQPTTIGALPVAAARDCVCEVAYLPGLAMRKAADLYPGKSKTDAPCFQLAFLALCSAGVNIPAVTRNYTLRAHHD